jgi:hypothetical protein
MKKIKAFSIREIVIKLFFLTGLLALTLIHNSCSVTSPSSTNNQFDVQIMSDPVGARIEINGKYVGDAPLIVKIEGSGDRTFMRNTSILAGDPVYGYEFTQQKYYTGNTYARGLSDKIPEKILFKVDRGMAYSKTKYLR